jgi:PAS domain S-box-containing protein
MESPMNLHKFLRDNWFMWLPPLLWTILLAAALAWELWQRTLPGIPALSLIWLLGAGAFVLGGQQLRLRIRERDEAIGNETTQRLQLEAIVTALPDLILRYDRDGIILEVITSDQLQTVGPPDKLIGSNPHDWLPADLAEARLFHIQQALEQNKLQRYEYEIEVDGAWRWEEARLTPTPAGEVIALIRDITNRGETEYKPQESVANFRSFFDTVADFLFILDDKGRILEVNRTVLDRLGYPFEALAGQPVLRVHPEARREEAGRIVAAILQGTESYCPVPLLTNKGQLIPVETYVTHGTWNSQPAIFGVSKDISALKLSEEKFAAAFNHSPAMVGLSDMETGTYIEVNQSFYDILGFTPAEVIGHKATDILKLDADFRARTIALMQEQGEVRNLETILYNKAGEPLTVLLSAQIIELNDRRYNFTTALNITELIQSRTVIEQQLEQNRLLAELGTMATGSYRAEDVFDSLGRFLKGILTDHIILINQATPDQDYLITRQVIGLEDALWGQAERLLGFSAVGQKSAIVEEWRDLYFFQARVKKVPGGFSTLAATVIPQGIGKTVEKLLGLHDVFTIGIADHERIFGNVHILTRQPAVELPDALIETAVYHCFLAFSRLEAMQALADSNELLEQTGRMARVGSWEVNQDTGDVYWSPMTREIHEAPADFRPKLQTALSFYKEGRSRELITKLVTRAIEQEEPFDVELQLMTAKGNERWVRAIGRPEFRQGRCVRLYGTFQDIDDRKRAEEALRESEEKHRLFFENASIGIIHYSAQGVITDINETVIKTFGSTREKLIGLNIDKIPNRDFTVQVKKSLAGKQGHFEGEYTSYTGGRAAVIKADWIPIFNDNGITSGVGIVEDITDRVRAEQALNTERRRLAAILEGTNVGTWEWYVQSGKTIFNERWANIIGYTLAELEPVSIETWLQFAHPEDLKISGELLEKNFTGELDYYECEARMRHKAGHWVWVLDRGKVTTWSEDDQPLLMSGTHQDITERKQAQGALQEAEWRYRTVADFTYGWELWETPDGGIRYVSPACEQITGYTADQFTANPALLEEIIWPEDRGLWAQHRHDIAKTPGPSALRFRIRRKDGRPIWIAHACRPVVDEQQGFLGYRSSNRDVTEQVKLEESLRSAKEAAEAANRAKSAFLSNMSHELRTPLNGIMGYTQIFKLDPTLTAEQQEGIDIIHRSGEHLLTMITDILDLSKIEADRMELAETEFDLGQFLRVIVEMIRVRAEQKRLTFQFEAESGLPPRLRGDETRLRQVLLNLLGNAVKFTQQGRVTLRVQNYGQVNGPDGTPLQQLCFVVEDTGPGIDPAQRDNVFKPFQQAGDHTTHLQGTGLGLPISQKLVWMMGGTVQLESVTDDWQAGSRFRFEITLPVVEGSLPEMPAAKRAVSGYSRNRGDGPFNILAVDDSAENRVVLREFLTPLGFAVTEAADGLQAVEQAIAAPPDLIFMDLVMPVMDGLTATREIRQQPALTDVPVVAISASVSRESRRKSQVMGCDAFLDKPFDGEQVFEKLGQLLP